MKKFDPDAFRKLPMNEPQTITPAAPVADAILPLLVDSKRAAQLCGISRTTWYSLMSSGRIGPPAIRLGSRCLFSVADLTAWIALRNPETGELPSRQRWIAIQKGQQR